MLNVSGDFLTAIKQGSRTVSASIGYDNKAFTNLILNGDFSSGITSWAGSNGSTIATQTTSPTGFLPRGAGQCAKNTCVTGQTNGYSTQNPTLIANNIYYVSAWAYVPTASTGSAGLQLWYNNAGWYGLKTISIPERDKWVYKSTTFTPNSTYPSTIIGVGLGSTVAGAVSYSTNVTLINLTAIYGAGSEPSQSYMDGLFARISFFNGTKNVPAQFIGDRIFNSAVNNGDFSNGTTGWLSSGATGFGVTNNEASFTGTYQYAQMYQSVPMIVGHKYYYSAEIKSTASVSFNLNKSGSSNWFGSVQYAGGGSYTRVSNMAVIPADATAPAISIGDSHASGWVQISVKNVILIDLSALYGLGSEPTQAYMDSIVTTNGWFKQERLLEDNCILGDFNIDSALGNGNLPSIGATISNKLTLNLINDPVLPQTIIGKTIRPYVGVDLTGTGSYEWITLGEFYADYDGVDIGKLETTIEAFDMMAEYTNITYTAMAGLTMTVQGVINDLTNNYGIRFAPLTGLPTTTAIKVTPTGSVRQVISEIASLMSTNATTNYDGCIEFVFMNTIPSATFSMGLDNYTDFKLQPDSLLSFTELIATDGNTEVPWGNTSGYALSFQNKQVTVLADVQAVYNRIFPINYYAYTMKAQGMPHLELGDVVSFTYVKLDGTTATINVPILKHKFTFKGAFVSEFSASAPQQQTTSVTVTSGSSLADAVDVTYGDLNEAIEIASQQITGNNGGYITTILDENNQPKELVISNTLNYNTADKVWRWNNSGLGFSSTGYTGSYGLAFTADGQIVADKITTGILNANIIKAGIIKDASNQSWIDMTNGKFNFGNGKLVWDGSTFSINFAGTNLGSALDAKVDDSTMSPYLSNIRFDNGMITLGKVGNPFSVNVTNQAMEFVDNGTTGGALNLTAISGNGTSITCTYPSQAVIPYQVGGYIQISGCSVSAYNGTWKVTSCTATQVVATSTATGTVSTGFGVIQYGSSPNTVAYINGQKMFITDLQVTDAVQVGNHVITEYDANITLVKYAG